MGISTSQSRNGNLPVELTSFVGRRSEIAEVRRLLADSRLVTLVGFGGVGKSRIATRAARGLRRAFADGVWVVELGALRDGELLAHEILDTLGVVHQSNLAGPNVLTEHLRDRSLLLVLDGCEHLLDSCAPLVARLLNASGGLRILVTGRQALRVNGERSIRVLPLDVPDLDDLPATPGEAVEYAAVELFTQRAEAAVPEFEVTAENQAVVSRLCARLEGIPLAIELAAVQLRALSVDDLLSRLDNRFDVLTAGLRTAPARHQTLEATVDWSFELLEPREQKLWARSSVFLGSFDLAATEAVCCGDDLAREDILEALGGLVDMSVVMRVERGGHVRFQLLDTVRDYGLDRLRAMGEEIELHRRHAAWTLEMVELAGPDAFGPDQESSLALLRLERANLRTAMDFSLSYPGETSRGLLLAAGAWFFWAAGSHLPEGRYWLDRALAADTDPSVPRARALWTSAFFAALQGDQKAATSLAQESAEVARDLSAPIPLAYAIHMRGLSAELSGDLTIAAPLLEKARAMYDELGLANSFVALLGIHLGLASFFQGDLDRADELFTRCREVCTREGDRWVLSYALQVSGLVELQRGNLNEASRLVSSGVTISRALADTLGMATGLDALAWVAAAQHQSGRAATLLGAARHTWSQIGGTFFGSRNLDPLREQAVERARSDIGDLEFGLALSHGARLDLADAIRVALDETPPTRPEAKGARDRGGRQTRSSDLAISLTRREGEISELISQGLSNKEIAANLVISQRTVEGHVQRMLNKFGFYSRTQIATWVAEHRPTEEPAP